MNNLIAGIVEFPTILFVVVGGAALVTMLVAGIKLRRQAAAPKPPRVDLVGKTCVVVSNGPTATEAEVTAPEGATQIIKIRPAQEEQPNLQSLRSGSTALIYDYDNTGGFFVVSPLAKQREKSE